MAKSVTRLERLCGSL